MKKLVFLLAAVVLTAISAKVFAQDTGIAPEVGSVHDYSVTYLSGNTYSWDITSDAAGQNSVINSVVPPLIPNANGNSVSVTWANPDVAHNKVYFVHVVETDASGCSNHKVLAVQPVNNFTLNIVNVDDAGANLAATDSLDNAVCAPNVLVTGWLGTDDGTAGAVNSGNSTGFTYDYGKVVFYYKISASGINVETTSWTPEFNIKQIAGANATVTIDSIIGGATPSGTWATTTWPTDGTTINPTIGEGTGHNVLWVRVTVVNGDGLPTAVNENLSNNDFTFTLTGGTDENLNPQNSLGNTTTVQTQSARPSTTDIQTD